MKIKNLVLLAFLIFLFSLPIFADEKTIPVDGWIYFQPLSEWTKESRGFCIDKSRGFVESKLSEKISGLVEFQISPNVQLIKAQIEYSFGSQMVIIGQQSNTFKFYNPPPHKRIIVQYPLAGLIPTYDDLGITWQGRAWDFDYRFSILNGTGRNVKDDNKDKDYVAYLKFSPTKQVSLAGCWQGGWQGADDKYYRSGYWFQGEIIPFSKLLIKPTWVKRKDLRKDSEGWFVVSLLRINSKDQLLFQYLKDTNKEKEITLGAILYSGKRTRFFPNVFLRKKLDGKYDYGIYFLTQINIGKDL